MDDRCGARFVVHGRVQGVGFRYFSVRRARRLGLSGWVRNEADGTVELLAEGETEAVDRLAAWLEQGPPGARVVRVERFEVPVTARYPGFDVTD